MQNGESLGGAGGGGNGSGMRGALGRRELSKSLK